MRSADRVGFTLAEIVVVLLILGISAAVVVPAFGAATTRAADGEVAPTLASLLMRARRAAIDRATTVRASVDVTRGRVLITSTGADSSTVIADTTLVLPRGVTLESSSPRARYVFRLDGSGAGDTLVVNGQGTTRITMDALTGAVRSDAR